jgi:hypothetical protein
MISNFKDLQFFAFARANFLTEKTITGNTDIIIPNTTFNQQLL